MTIKLILRGPAGAPAWPLMALSMGLAAVPSWVRADPAPPTSYETLNFGTASTFLTGIRGDNIVGNYVIPGTTETGGIYYNLTTGVWSAMPVSTTNGANYPGAIGSSPYGPSFGNPGGVLRVVGSYQTSASAPYDLSYIYDGAAAPGDQLTTLVYPDGTSPTLFTIAHSTFGNQVVGNYDTQLDEGNAFIYNIDTGVYVKNNIAGASTTAYGIYGDKIAGGYGEILVDGVLHAEHGYIYDQVTQTYETYDHPDAVATHFEGITSAGRPDEYNLVVNWVDIHGVVHPAVLHVNTLTDTRTWHEIDIPGDVVSSNSAYGDKVIGIYIANGQTNGYVATIPGIYNPTVNSTETTFTGVDSAFLDGVKGEDIVNEADITATGNGGVAMRGETYGVMTNTATITASGIAGAAVEMHGKFGTLLNSGTLKTTFESDALRTDETSEGTIIVNTGIIDGRLAAELGEGKRFENSGWLGVSGTVPSITHFFQGTVVQTEAGTYAARIMDVGNDKLDVTGAVRLDGTMAVSFQTDSLLKNYTLIDATDEITGTFGTLTTYGLPALFATSLGYTSTEVSLNVASGLAQLSGTTSNQRAVGGAIDGIINNTAGNELGELPAALSPLYALDAAQLPGALGALSGEAYASEQTVLIGDSLYTRQAILGRLRQGSYSGEAGAVHALAQGGPALAPVTEAALSSGTVWGQVFGGSSNLDGDGVSSVDETIGGIITGGDVRIDNWLVGAAIGYSQSNADVDDLASSFQADSLLLGLYAGTSAGPWNVRFGASYAFSQIDADRTIAYPGYAEKAKADYDAGTAQAFAEIGYGFAVDAVAIEPFANLAWVNLHTDDFKESGASAGLSGSSTSSNVGYTSLGVRAATSMEVGSGMVLQPHASLAWQIAFGDVTPETTLGFISAPAASFQISGVPLAENTALVELGVDMIVNPQTRVGLSYMGQFASDISQNVVKADLAWRF